MTGQSGGGGVPSGAAGGVLGGSYPSPTFATNGTTPILGVSTAVLGADVNLTVLGTWVDVLSLALLAGTYLVTASIELYYPTDSSLTWANGRVWDGTTVYMGSEGTLLSGNLGSLALYMGFPVVLAGPATLRLAGRTSRAASKAVHLDFQTSSLPVTYISALRIA